MKEDAVSLKIDDAIERRWYFTGRSWERAAVVHALRSGGLERLAAAFERGEHVAGDAAAFRSLCAEYARGNG